MQNNREKSGKCVSDRGNLKRLFFQGYIEAIFGPLMKMKASALNDQ